MEKFFYCIYLGDAYNVEDSIKEKEVDINIQDKNGLSALCFACYKEKIKVVHVLLNYFINSRLFTYKSGCHALHYAAQSGNLELFKLVYSYDSELLNIPNTNGDTPLMFAGTTNSRSLFKYILNLKVDLKAKNHNNFSLLHCILSSLKGIIKLYFRRFRILLFY